MLEVGSVGVKGYCHLEGVSEERLETVIASVVLDVGETLLDDTREFGRWADWIGVPRHTFSALLGAVTAAGRNNAETFQYFRPGFDLELERRRRDESGVGELIEEVDLYPDARPGLAALRERGIWVGLAGNQTACAAKLLRALDLPVDANPFDHIQHAAEQWDQLGHPDPTRLGITAGPAGQTVWLDSPLRSLTSLTVAKEP